MTMFGAGEQLMSAQITCNAVHHQAAFAFNRIAVATCCAAVSFFIQPAIPK